MWDLGGFKLSKKFTFKLFHFVKVLSLHVGFFGMQVPKPSGKILVQCRYVMGQIMIFILQKESNVDALFFLVLYFFTLTPFDRCAKYWYCASKQACTCSSSGKQPSRLVHKDDDAWQLLTRKSFIFLRTPFLIFKYPITLLFRKRNNSRLMFQTRSKN